MTKNTFIIRTLFFDLVLIYMFFSKLEFVLKESIYLIIVAIIAFICIGYGQVIMYNHSRDISLYSSSFINIYL